MMEIEPLKWYPGIMSITTKRFKNNIKNYDTKPITWNAFKDIILVVKKIRGLFKIKPDSVGGSAVVGVTIPGR